MSPRKTPIPLSEIDLDKLRDLYVVENVSSPAIAKMLGISVSRVWALLHSMGVAKRGRAVVEEARSLYFDQGWTLQQIANRLGVTRQAVHQRLTLAGYDLKTAREQKPLIDAEILRELYVTKLGTIKAIAAELGTPDHFVSRSLREHGIVRPFGRRKQIDRELLENLYIKQGLFMREIGDRLGMDKSHVAAELNRHNITFRHLPAGRIVRPDRRTLERQYTDPSLSLKEISLGFGVSPGTVVKWVDEYGIKHRARRRGLPSLGVDRDRLYKLYVTDKLSATGIARMLGVSQSHVCKYLKRYGIESRGLGRITLEADLFQKLLVEEGLTQKQVAKKLGIGVTVIRREGLRYGFFGRRNSE